MKTLSHWIGGKPVEGVSGNFGPVYNPATGAQEKQVAFASADEVDAAVGAARKPSGPGAPAPWPSAPRCCSSTASWSTRTARSSPG